MAHELEQLRDGRTAFVSARQPAWHQLGTVHERTMTADEIMTRAFLGGWKVRKIALYGREITPQGVTRIDCPDKWMTVRSNIDTGEAEYLGVVGEDYTPVQNEQVAEMLDRLVDAAGGAHFETAGSLRGGRRVFVTMKLPKGMRIAGVDDMDLYLAATTSHDGTAGLRVDATPVRIVCANTDRAALAATKGFYVFRHTTNVHAQIAQAREAMGLMWDYFDEFQRAAERMINESLSMGQFEKVVEQLWPLPEDASEPTKRNHRQRQAALRYLIRDADTQKAIRNTRWAGYQAITEYVDHYAPAKTIELRANRAVAGPGAELKSRAFELLAV